MKLEDLTGKIVNTYQIIKTYTYRQEVKYRVRCLICGKQISLSGSELHTPCECVKPDDTIGHTYGYLFVFGEYAKNQKTHCKCICQLCGKITDVLRENLVSGHTKSCGCLKEKDLSGQTFGNLKVLKRFTKNGETYYYCACQLCGNIITKRHDAVSLSTSCGCDKKEVRADALRKKAFVDGTQIAKIRLNKEPTKANKSGFVGVCWDKSRGKWKADIRFKGKKYNLGRFNHIQDAIDARKEAEEKLFRDFLKWYEEYKK